MGRPPMPWGSALWGVMGSEGLTYPLSSFQAQTGLGTWKDPGTRVGSCCKGEAEKTPAGPLPAGPSDAGPRAFVGLEDLVL